MRDLHELDRFRVTDPGMLERYGGYPGDATCGLFKVPSPQVPPETLRIIAAADSGWDHVSVSLVRRVPTWDEMEHVKRLFFLPEETAMQLHVPPLEHVNCHPHVLHLWRPHWVEIPRPPAWMVA